eukprot:2249316-Rhodomonas_salina.1
MGFEGFDSERAKTAGHHPLFPHHVPAFSARPRDMFMSPLFPAHVPYAYVHVPHLSSIRPYTLTQAPHLSNTRPMCKSNAHAPERKQTTLRSASSLSAVRSEGRG